LVLRGATRVARGRGAPTHARRSQPREPPAAAPWRWVAFRRVPRLRARARPRSAPRSRPPAVVDAASAPRDGRAVRGRVRARRRRAGAGPRRDLRGVSPARRDRLVPAERAWGARAVLPRPPGGVAARAIVAPEIIGRRPGPAPSPRSRRRRSPRERRRPRLDRPVRSRPEGGAPRRP